MSVNKDDIIKDLKFMLNTASDQKFIDKFTKQKAHNKIQRSIKELSKKYGCIGKTEVKVGGALDVAWFNKNDNNFVAIFEIDSCYRKKSIAKLISTKSLYKFWVYYGRDKLPDYICDVDIIQKPIVFRRKRY